MMRQVRNRGTPPIISYRHTGALLAGIQAQRWKSILQPGRAEKQLYRAFRRMSSGIRRITPAKRRRLIRPTRAITYCCAALLRSVFWSAGLSDIYRHWCTRSIRNPLSLRQRLLFQNRLKYLIGIVPMLGCKGFPKLAFFLNNWVLPHDLFLHQFKGSTNNRRFKTKPSACGFDLRKIAGTRVGFLFHMHHSLIEPGPLISLDELQSKRLRVCACSAEGRLPEALRQAHDGLSAAKPIMASCGGIDGFRCAQPILPCWARG